MIDMEALGRYLNDHLTGAEFGCELVRRISAEADGDLDDLVADIEADRETLATIIDELGLRSPPVRRALGSAMEKVGQIRLNSAVVGSQRLAHFLETEALSVGIRGKQDLWEALGSLAEADPEGRVARWDFEALRARAEDQQERLASQRGSAAALALVQAK